MNSYAQAHKPVTKLHYTIDTFKYKEEAIAIQRYKGVDLNKAADHGTADLLKIELYALQHDLDEMKTSVSSNSPNYVGTVEFHWDKVRQYAGDLDLSNYDREYAFYRKMCGVKSREEQMEEDNRVIRREIASQDSMNAVHKEREKQFRLRDPNVITEEDRQLAAGYRYGTSSSFDVETMAKAKIERIEARRRDSIDRVETKQRDSINKVNASKQAKIDAANEKKERAAAQVRTQKRKAELIAKYGENYGTIIAAGKVVIGMTKEMCIASWGKPLDVHKTIMANMVIEQWMYNYSSLLMFENGKLTQITQ